MINKKAIYTILMSPYAVKTSHFEGPLPLLLDLIEKRKLHINEVSLAKVADDFLDYVGKGGLFPVSESADFLLVASTLVLIKSKSLLPNLSLTEEEEGNIAELERRLKAYEVLKEGASLIGTLSRKRKSIVLPLERPIMPVFSPGSLSIGMVVSAIKEIINELPVVEKMSSTVVQKVMSLEEAMTDLSERIKTNLKMSFRDFSHSSKAEKINVIVSFLALLEMIKRGIVNAIQANKFEDISIQPEELGVPNYH